MSEITVTAQLSTMRRLMKAAEEGLIRDVDLQKLIFNPKGPILSDAVLNVRRLSDALGTWKPDQPVGEFSAWDLQLDGNDQPVFLSVIHGKRALLRNHDCHDRIEGFESLFLECAPPEGAQQYSQRLMIQPIYCEGSMLVSWFSFAKERQDSDLMERWWEVYLDERLYARQEEVGIFEPALWRNELVYASYVSAKPEKVPAPLGHVLHVGEKHFVMTGWPLQFLDEGYHLGSGQLFTRQLHQIDDRTVERVGILRINGSLTGVVFHQLLERPASTDGDLTRSNGSVFYIEADGRVQRYDREREVFVEEKAGVDRKHYVANYTQLPDGRTAYVATRASDQYYLPRHLRWECWYCDGQLEPYAFDQVTPLFKGDDVEIEEDWCYYGLLGRHLYLMRLPRRK